MDITQDGNASQDSLKDTAKKSAQKADDFADKAGEAELDEAHEVGEKIQQNPVYQVFVTIGLCIYGLVHLAIAFVALNIAWAGPASSTNASESGILKTLAQQPFGWAILLFCAVGLATLVVWQAIEAAVGNTHVSGKKRLRKRLGSVGRAITYAALVITCISALMGSSSSGEQKQESMVAMVLNLPLGQVLVGLVALGIIAVGISQIVKGVGRKFKEDLDGSVSDPVVTVGIAGYVTKGVAIGIVGLLFGWAAIQHNPEAAGGTNSALRSIVEQPFGPYLLTLVALGLVAFGVFCFFWAFNARHEKAND